MRLVSLICALSWAALIYYLSDQPSIELTPVFEHQDKLFHVTAYFVLGFLTLGAMPSGPRGYASGPTAWAIILAGLYGVLDEYHQSFIPGRDASVHDVAADLTGVLLGVGLLFYLVRQFSRRTNRITT